MLFHNIIGDIYIKHTLHLNCGTMDKNKQINERKEGHACHTFQSIVTKSQQEVVSASIISNKVMNYTKYSSYHYESYLSSVLAWWQDSILVKSQVNKTISTYLALMLRFFLTNGDHKLYCSTVNSLPYMFHLIVNPFIKCIHLTSDVFISNIPLKFTSACA